MVQTYSIQETLRDGRSVTIRSLRPEDRSAMLSAVGRVSAEALYRRFFGPKRGFTDKEIDYFVNVDFDKHVALVAVIDESGERIIIGGGRYIETEPGTAELAFAVVDGYQGLGIASALLRHLVLIARNSGVRMLAADVLPDNGSMLAVFRKFGFVSTRKAGEVHVVLGLDQKPS